MVEMLRKKILTGSVGCVAAWWVRSDTSWFGSREWAAHES
jgi:hypothetical protein